MAKKLGEIKVSTVNVLVNKWFFRAIKNHFHYCASVYPLIALPRKEGAVHVL